MRLLQLPLLPTLLVFSTSLAFVPGALAQGGPGPQSCQGFSPGSYVFQVSGHLIEPLTTASRSLGIIGMFRVDSLGRILYGAEDVNAPSGSLANQPITGFCINQTGQQQRLVLQPATGQAQTFILEPNGLLYIGPGAVATGTIAFQDIYAAHSAISGIYTIPLSGETACLQFCHYGGHPAGEISATAVLTLGSMLNKFGPHTVTGTVDANVASAVALNQAVTGDTDSEPALFGRFQLSFSVPGEAADLPIHFVAYVVERNSFVILSADPHSEAALLTGIGHSE